jgi:hypothetical protein
MPKEVMVASDGGGSCVVVHFTLTHNPRHGLRFASIETPEGGQRRDFSLPIALLEDTVLFSSTGRLLDVRRILPSFDNGRHVLPRSPRGHATFIILRIAVWFTTRD